MRLIYMSRLMYIPRCLWTGPQKVVFASSYEHTASPGITCQGTEEVECVEGFDFARVCGSVLLCSNYWFGHCGWTGPQKWFLAIAMSTGVPRCNWPDHIWTGFVFHLSNVKQTTSSPCQIMLKLTRSYANWFHIIILVTTCPQKVFFYQ